MARLSSVKLSPSDWVIATLYALTSTAADFAALYCCVRAVLAPPARCLAPVLTARQATLCRRFRPPATGSLALAYAAGQAATAIPLLPGGIGLVESAMTVTLTAARAGFVAALSMVLIYRLVSFWLVIAVGGLCWWARRRRRQPGAAAISPSG